MHNKPYLLALNRINHIGPRTVIKLLARWPNLEAMFQLSAAQLVHAGLPQKMANAIESFDFQSIDADVQWESMEHQTILTWACPKYPRLLKEIYDPPVVLYATGNLASLEQPLVAMVGTRKPSVTGHETAWRFAHALALRGVSIVSGLALGIDAQAHSGCLAANGHTIAVMGTGMHYIYPRQHRPLAERICEKGLLLSEFPLESSPKAGHFPRRNRIISGLSSITLVVEAAIRSGSLITARLAMEQNRDVLAIPGSIHNPQARGCHYLLQQGAKLVTNSDDVYDELGLDSNQVTHVKPITGLASENINLVKCIGFETTTIDQMLVRSGLKIETVACDLAELELQGIVKAVPGGYMRCKL